MMMMILTGIVRQSRHCRHINAQQLQQLQVCVYPHHTCVCPLTHVHHTCVCVALTRVSDASQVCLVEGLTMRQKGPTGSRWYERGQAFATAAETAFQAAAAFFDLPPPELCCHSPETESWGTHHSKAFLFGYADGGVRVVVHTANLVVGDCNYKTQGVWWQDFPPKQQQQGQGPGQQQQQGRQQPATEFERTLSAYLHSLKLPGPWGQRMQQLVAGADFSAARGVLIGSVPGRHEGRVGGGTPSRTNIA